MKFNNNTKPRLSVNSAMNRLFYLIVAAVLFWGIVSPMYLMHATKETYSHLDIRTTRPGGETGRPDGTPQSAVERRMDSPVVKMSGAGNGASAAGSARVWTLADAPRSTQVDKMSWLEKCDAIWQNNQNYLQQSVGRATKSSSNVTLVSGMFDLGRGELKNDFKRSFQHYVDRFATFLLYEFPIVIFIQEEHHQDFLPYIEKRTHPTYIIYKSLDDIRSMAFYQPVQKIRLRPDWSRQAGWLEQSPQATLELYNPMVMSKILWTREVAELNPFNTDSFLWIDGGHLCNDPWNLKETQIQLFKDHFDKLLITFFDYEPVSEIHGFEREAFAEYTGNYDFIVRVGRGGVFGGTREYLNVAAEMYQEILMETLNAGYMGTEECIFSILYYRFPELIHDFDNGAGGNCAIFYNAYHGLGPRPWENPIKKNDLIDGFDLRDLECGLKEGGLRCWNKDNKKLCPSYVTPRFLTLADSQWSCQRWGDSYCTVQCNGVDSVESWFAHQCDFRDIWTCPPYPRVPYSAFNDPLTEAEKRKVSWVPIVEELYPNDDVVVQYTYDDGRIVNYIVGSEKEPEPEPEWVHMTFTQEEKRFSDEMKRKMDPANRKTLEEYGVDMRGLKCEILNGREQCYLENPRHPEYRDKCPPWVNTEYIAIASDQWSCRMETSDKTYCTALCQDGTDRVAWTAYDVAWCKDNPTNCAPRPPRIPFSEYQLKTWSQPPKPVKPCDSIPISRFRNMPKISVAVLTRGKETASLSLSSSSWEQAGLLQYVDEVLFFVNERSPDMAKLLAPFQEPPFNARVLGSDTNLGILTALNYLLGNATNEYVLFLEKDFRLVESLPCALEQIEAGLEMLENEEAEVIKYRSRYNAGRPNWAELLFRDDEERVFQQQPNLLCNFYHWIDDPDQRWPEQFSICHTNPTMYCTTAEFCNWTNNPFIVSKEWWKREYWDKFEVIRNPPEGFDLETWMNWDPDAWNHRGWIIAEGDGMFKHADANNFGIW